MSTNFDDEYDTKTALAWETLKARFSPLLESPADVTDKYEKAALVENLMEAEYAIRASLELLLTPSTFAMTQNGAQLERSMTDALKVLTHLVGECPQDNSDEATK